MGLKSFLRREKEKTADDVQWALSQSPETANKTLRFLRKSLPVKLGAVLVVLGGIYVAVTSLNLVQLAALAYTLVGVGVAHVSDYGFSDWESYYATLFWLPTVLYGALPDRFRVEK